MQVFQFIPGVHDEPPYYFDMREDASPKLMIPEVCCIACLYASLLQTVICSPAHQQFAADHLLGTCLYFEGIRKAQGLDRKTVP